MSKVDLLPRQVAIRSILQPMHAARLFSTVLGAKYFDRRRPPDPTTALTRHSYGAEIMLSALLDIARLEGGTIQTKETTLSVA